MQAHAEGREWRAWSNVQLVWKRGTPEPGLCSVGSSPMQPCTGAQAHWWPSEAIRPGSLSRARAFARARPDNRLRKRGVGSFPRIGFPSPSAGLKGKLLRGGRGTLKFTAQARWTQPRDCVSHCELLPSPSVKLAA
eukprot:362342-Chlamydomonas_euryale.AAC.14